MPSLARQIASLIRCARRPVLSEPTRCIPSRVAAGEGAAGASGDPAALERAVIRSVEIKSAVVGEDEKEAGRRALLNLGHTFGHAIEAEVGFDEDALAHGEAVALGCCMALRYSAREGLCSAEDAARVEAVVAAAGLPTRLDQAGAFEGDRLLALMAAAQKAWNEHKGMGTANPADPFVAGVALVRAAGGFREGFEGSQDHDLLLRCLPHLKPGQIVHVPRVLYHWRAARGSTAQASAAKSYTTQAGLKALRDHVIKTADNVGTKFSDEARKMHYGETEERGIRGQATPEQTRDLLEEGISVMPLPIPDALKGPVQ